MTAPEAIAHAEAKGAFLTEFFGEVTLRIQSGEVVLVEVTQRIKEIAKTAA